MEISKRIKIALVVPNLNRGGAEKVLLHFVNNLDYTKYQPFVFALKKEGDLLPFINHEVEVVDLDRPRVYFSIFKIKQLVKEYKIDVLIGWMGHINAVLAFFRPLLPGKLVLMCRESSIPSRYIKYYRLSGVFRFMYRFMNRYNGIICQSDAMKQDLVENFSVQPEKICVINNPVADPATDMLISSEAAVFIGQDNRLVLFVGRFSAEKQVGLLIETMELLPAGYRLLLVGYGPLEQEVRKKIEETGLQDRIMIISGCNNPAPYYRKAGCLVLSSSFEGFPNVLLEANLQGCPAAVYQTRGGAKEIITPGNGIYIEPGSPGGLKDLVGAITSICENPGQYDRDKIARYTKEKYGVKKIVNTYLGYIEDNIKQHTV